MHIAQNISRIANAGIVLYTGEKSQFVKVIWVRILILLVFALGAIVMMNLVSAKVNLFPAFWLVVGLIMAYSVSKFHPFSILLKDKKLEIEEINLFGQLRSTEYLLDQCKWHMGEKIIRRGVIGTYLTISCQDKVLVELSDGSHGWSVPLLKNLYSDLQESLQ